MKRIIILSDSLGRPRPNIGLKERTVYSDIYGKKLGELLGTEYDVEICYVESLDTSDGVFWSERMVAFREPDMVIFQIGINDCAPRLFSKKSQNIIFKPWFRKITKDFFLKVLSHYRGFITKHIKKVYVPLKQYKCNFKKMMADVRIYSPHCMFYCISIAYGDELYIAKSPDINKNVKKYNLVLSELFQDRYIDINALQVSKLHISDGVHITKEAHMELAKVLYARIKEDENVRNCSYNWWN